MISDYIFLFPVFVCVCANAQIINLKRFQYLNGRWVKSHKIVNFPLQAFDPSAYLAERDPKSPLEKTIPPASPVFPANSSSSDPSVQHHPRLQQVEHFHQQGENQCSSLHLTTSTAVFTSCFHIDAMIMLFCMIYSDLVLIFRFSLTCNLIL